MSLSCFTQAYGADHHMTDFKLELLTSAGPQPPTNVRVTDAQATVTGSKLGSLGKFHTTRDPVFCVP